MAVRCVRDVKERVTFTYLQERWKEKNMESKKPFRKFFADEHNELFQKLFKDGLLWRLFTLIAFRARRVLKPSPEGLEQFEFVLSETEFAKFGLKESQRGQIRRKILKLSRFGLISKTEKKIEDTKAIVYRFVPNQLVDINQEIESEIEIKQRENEERVETNKNDKNVKNDTFSEKEKELAKRIARWGTSRAINYSYKTLDEYERDVLPHIKRLGIKTVYKIFANSEDNKKFWYELKKQ